MSEGIVDRGYAPTPRANQPVYGDGRLAYEEPAKSQEHIDRWPHAAIAAAIVVPVVAAYSAIGYGLYRALSVIF